MAWQPDPASQPAYAACCNARTGQRGGVLAGGSAVARRQKVLPLSTSGVPGWCRARRSMAGLTQSVVRRGVVGRRGAVAVDGGGAGTVVANDGALALHHRGRESEVRWG
jgi:hypothetical protein